MDEAKAGKVATLPSSAFTSSKLDGATQTNAVDKVQDVVTVSWPDGTERQIQISPETKKRLDKLFNEIDLDKDGKIDIADLETALNKRGHTSKSKNHAREFLQRSDTNQSGDVNFSEFIEYCLEHEKRLQVIFKDIDVNQDGKLDDVEIMDAFKKLGIAIDKDEANKLIQKMNKDGTLSITFEEWRDYLILYPAEEIRDLMRFWKHSFVLDFGDDSGVVPDDFTAKEMHTGMWWRHLIAGGVAGAVSRTCTAPLDRLKVFLQVRGTEFGSLSICLKHMLQEGGYYSLWRGNGINVLKIAPETALKFMAYEQAKIFIRGSRTSELTIYERFLAGAMAGGLSQSVIYPMEVLKTRLCLGKTGQYTGMVDAAKKIYVNEGPRAFYRGYIPNLLGIIPYAGIDLAVYETLKKWYLRTHSDSEDPGVLVLLACGTASSSCGQIASYPLALVRTRLQAQVGQPADNMLGQFRKIINKEGLPGLYRGIAPNFMKVAPAVSISYVVYEHTRRSLGATMS